MKSKILFLTLIFFSFHFLSEANPEFDQLKKEIKKDLKWYSDKFIYSHYKNAGIDIDSLGKATEIKLRKLLAFKESRDLDLKEFPNLKMNTSTNDSLRIRFYYFSHMVGPTGYEAVHTVVQWQNKTGKLFSYIISSKVPGTISSIHKLKSKNTELFLVFSRHYFREGIYVIQFKGDYLLTNYPAFVKEFGIELKGANISYNPQNQEISIGLYEDNAGMEDVVEPLMNKVNDPQKGESYKKILKLFEDKEQVILKFNGRKFVE